MRRLLHFALGFCLWLVFLYYWYLVGHRPLNPQTVTALVALGTLVAGSVIFLVWWILHNIRIYRKLQRRRSRPAPEESFFKDYLGRWVVVDDRRRLSSAPYVEIEIRPVERPGGERVEEKVYRTGRPLPG